MNGGRHGPPITIDGCLTEIGHALLIGVGIIITVAAGIWFFSAPPDVCVRFDSIKVIEKTTQQQEILVDKKVCTEFAPSPKPSPFWQAWEWVKS